MVAETARPNETSTNRWLRPTLAFARRTVLAQTKNRRAMLFSVGLPVLFYLLDTRLAVQQSAPIGPATKTTIAVAMGTFGAFLVALTGFARQLGDDVAQKRYRKLRSLPISPVTDVAGRAVGSYVVALVAYAITLVVAFADGGSFAAVSPVSVLVVLGSLFAFCVVAMAAATVVTVALPGGDTYRNTVFVVLVCYYLTGYNGVDPGILPAGVRGCVNYVPNSLATRMQLAYTVGDGGGSVPLPDTLAFGALLVGYALVFVLVAGGLFDRYVYAGEVGE